MQCRGDRCAFYVGAKEAVGSSNGTGGNAEYRLASCFDDAKERKMPMAHWRIGAMQWCRWICRRNIDS